MAIKTPVKRQNKCNNLSGKEWLKNSISIWSGLKKSPEEKAIKHPASFPFALVKRLLDSFTNDDDKVVLDPFVGIGSTVIQAMRSNKYGIGFDIYKEYLEIAKNRIMQTNLFDHNNAKYSFILDNALNIPKHLDNDSVDIIITSPPYWDILNQKRTADGKEKRKYGDNVEDLGLLGEYNSFMQQLSRIFAVVTKILKKNKYCIINVMDVRK